MHVEEQNSLLCSSINCVIKSSLYCWEHYVCFILENVKLHFLICLMRELKEYLISLHIPRQ